MRADPLAPAETLSVSRIREQSAKREAAERKTEALRWMVAEETAARVAAQHEAAALRCAMAHESAARAALQQQADLVFSSTSWRLTRPLRAAITAGRRLADLLIALTTARRVPPIDSESPDFSRVFDGDWYLASYPDVATSGMEPLRHYRTVGAAAGYDPCPLFNSRWYLERNPEIAESGLSAVEHYLRIGAGQLRDPHPNFNTAFYVHEHPEAAANPLAHYLRVGRLQGWPTQPPFKLADYLPSAESASTPPRGVAVDIVIPVYRGLEETRRCIESVLSDPQRPPGRIVVVDDCSPEPGLSEWLGSSAERGAITLLRNDRNLGFVASINRGIAETGRQDVVLLNSDTEVPHGWLRRLATHAHGAPRIGTVTPFSNNATICSYPAPLGGTLPGSRSPAAIDAACRAANVGRSVPVPTGIGFCMYVRRDCLDAVGPFDEQTFGRGYGEENDFCLRAAAIGWQHLLACDIFVYHAGGVSFGADSPDRARAAQELRGRHPDYADTVARFVRRDPAKPYRFAVTAALFSAAAAPTILLVSHSLGGGTERHVSELMAAVAHRANLLLLQPCDDGVELSIPSLPGHSVLRLPSGHELGDLAALLRSCNVRRVHVHHLVGLGFDLRELIERLRVPFDFTVHDYFPICPQVHLLSPSGEYCGEPDEAGCNACIARRPSHGARDIVAWRRQFAWLLEEADRVICPSEDARLRLRAHTSRRDLIFAPHEPVTSPEWLSAPPPLRPDERLRIGLIGAITPHKGRDTLLTCAAAADSAGTEFAIVGYCNPPIPPVLRGMIGQTGVYQEEELAALIARAAPHLLWFPVPCPESYSYTLSAAIASGLPIIATRLGALPERLAGRPWTWLVDPDAPVADWLDTFAAAREALLNGQLAVPGLPRATTQPFYADAYLQRAIEQAGVPPHARRGDFRGGAGRLTIALLPERSDDGGITHSGYVRLLLPFDHLARTHPDWVSVTLADSESALRRVADVLVCQRRVARDVAAAGQLTEHCRASGMRLVYDLDDDLLDSAATHRDGESIRQSAPVVRRMLSAADVVWVSTRGLQQRLAPVRPDAQLVCSRLDERLWGRVPAEPWSAADASGPVRILYIGAPDHDRNLDLLEPVALRLQRDFGEEVSCEVVGVSSRSDLGPALHRVQPPAFADASYPGFVAWLTRRRRWHIGVAPLADSAVAGFTELNRLLEYSGLGLPVVASDVEAHREDGLTGSVGVHLVANDEDAWFGALAELVQDARHRRHRGERARDAVLRARTLATQDEELYRAVAEIVSRVSRDAQIASR